MKCFSLILEEMIVLYFQCYIYFGCLIDELLDFQEDGGEFSKMVVEDFFFSSESNLRFVVSSVFILYSFFFLHFHE